MAGRDGAYMASGAATAVRAAFLASGAATGAARRPCHLLKLSILKSIYTEMRANNFLLRLCCIATLTFQILATQVQAQAQAQEQAPPPVNMDTDANPSGSFSDVGRAVIELLKSRDTARFAEEMAPTADDFRTVLQTNLMLNDQASGYARAAGQELIASAQALLQTADSLHLDFLSSHLVAHVITPENIGTIYFGGNPRGTSPAQGSPFVRNLEIVLTPNANETTPTNSDFKIAITQLAKFPGGWKSEGIVQWTEFPSSVANEKVRRQLTILKLANDYKGLTAQDDPALLRLATAVIDSIRERDIHIYERDALANSDVMFSIVEKQMQGAPRKITRQDFDSNWNPEQQGWLKAAGTVFNLMDDAGLDFKDARIQVRDASIERMQPQRGAGTLDGLTGEQFKIQFAVQSGGKSKSGASLAGDYTVAADQVMHLGDDWKIMGNLRWDEMPAGILVAKAEAKMQFETYVAQHGAMPPGTMAPEIDFTRLDNGQKMKLSDLRGKVVVLDFWATWCGPCQEPMAHLQTLPGQHPDWKNRVAIVPLSIDDTIQIVRNHIEKRGWTNTFNVWAGEGGWFSAPAQTFRVKGVPTTYIIDAQGKIVTAGHPAALNIDDEVDGQLNMVKR